MPKEGTSDQKYYSFRCPWCRIKLTMQEPPRRTGYRCAYCREFFAIDSVNPETQDIYVVKIDREVAIDYMVKEKLSSPFNPNPNG